MTLTRRAGRIGAILIPVALAISACSGSTSSAAPSGAGASSVATQPPASATSTTGGEPSSAIAIPSFDLSELTKGLANVDSYQVSTTLKGVEQSKGTVVTKPVLSRDLIVGGDTRIVVIGDEAWVGTAGGELKAVPQAIATGLFANYDPTLLVAAFSGAGWAESATSKGSEQKNGVDTTHYRIDGSTIAAGFSGLPSGASIDTWVSDKGFIVALETAGWPSGDMSIQVTHLDDPANKVDRPS